MQYTSRAYRERLTTHSLRGSMGRRGNPYDNATMESFMKTLKYEEIYPREYSTIDDVIRRLPRFIEESTISAGCTPRSGTGRLMSSSGFTLTPLPRSKSAPSRCPQRGVHSRLE